MKDKFGEWDYERLAHNHFEVLFEEGDDGGYAAVVGINAEANARLIAAAPDLLAALEQLVALLPDQKLDQDAVQRQYVVQALAALSKARGKS